MSEPTLYQTRKGLHGKSSGRSVVNTLVAAGVLVPVERCKHDRWDGHWNLADDGMEWCLGAGIGGDDETT